MTKRKGWVGESQKHSMAVRGIRTKDDLFRKYKNLQLSTEEIKEIEQKKVSDKLLKNDIKNILLSLETKPINDITNSYHFKDLYNYFKFEPNYLVSKVKKRYELDREMGYARLGFLEEFVIQSKETGNLIKIHNYKWAIR